MYNLLTEYLVYLAKLNQSNLKTTFHQIDKICFFELSLNFQLLFWIDKPEARGRTIDALNTNIYKAFNTNNIEIPFPQRTVHIKK